MTNTRDRKGLPGLPEMLALLALAVGMFSPVAAAARQQDPGPATERIETSVVRYQKAVPRIRDTLEGLKQARASYIRELTASPGDLPRYRNADTRRRMVGVYLFDMTYAAVFDRKKQARESADAVQELLTSLGLSDERVIRQYRKLVREYEEQSARSLADNYEKIIDDFFREMAATEQGASLVSEAAYAWAIEGLFVTTEIVAQQNYPSLMLYRINEQAEAIKPVTALLETMHNDRRMARLVAGADKLAVLRSITGALKGAKHVTPQEVDALRRIVTPARKALFN